MLPVFVYGTLRRGSWNHDRWLVPWVEPSAPARRATLADHALHHVRGLPAVTPAVGRSVDGEVVRFRAEVYDGALAVLDEFEGVPLEEYERVAVRTTDGTKAWVWVAGPLLRPLLGDETAVASGDWLTVPVAR